jgi:hypothetical protein
MKKVLTGIGLILFCVILLAVTCNTASLLPASSSFRFVIWSDTKTGLNDFSTLSNQIKALNPIMTLYPGDLCESGATTACLDLWKAALDGGMSNGMSAITFASRGNHDSSNTSTWQSYFDFSGVASAIAANHYASYAADLTYSFDLGNSHFVMIDLPISGASSMDSGTMNWLDGDLAAAESRGLTHAFIAFHAPIYYVDGHADTIAEDLITVLNKHTIVSATFHGHEHVLAYVHIGSTRIQAVTHPFEEFVSGGAGASLYNCASGRSDWCQASFGFFVIDVSGSSFTVDAYLEGATAPVKSWTFSKTASPPPTNPSPSAN